MRERRFLPVARTFVLCVSCFSVSISANDFTHSKQSTTDKGSGSALANRACSCNLDTGTPLWREIADASRCWDAGRKIPPQLFAAAHGFYSALQQEASQSSIPPVSQVAEWNLPQSLATCVPGAFTVLLVLLLLWEAHDAPPDLLGNGLEAALQLRRVILHLASGPEIEPGYTQELEVLDCQSVSATAPDKTWPGILRLGVLDRLHIRLLRKDATRRSVALRTKEHYHQREHEERAQWAAAADTTEKTKASRTFCLCMLHGEGAATLNATLSSYRVGGLLGMAARRFIVFLEHPEDAAAGGEVPREIGCWRERLVRRYDLEVLRASRDSWHWPDPFIGKNHRLGKPGAAMVLCAEACDAEHVLFLEEDWELIVTQPELVHHRMEASMRVLAESLPSSSTLQAVNGGGDRSNRGPVILGVHLRHKILFGAPFYELVTAAQHNEPPSPFAAWYFSDDPVAERFPEGQWDPPFWDSMSLCDSERRSWWTALRHQRQAARTSESMRQASMRRMIMAEHDDVGHAGLDAEAASADVDDRQASRVWWCSSSSSLLCASTAAHRDPFRSLTHSTNPTLYRTANWRMYIGSFAAVLQDSRAVEEAVSSSYMWRVDPSFELALSLGLFRHHRLDRQRIPLVDEDLDVAFCIGDHAAS
eukprot:TRINITY_DN16134_c0_g1_i1.p1 TRINITY_DN16134_c0_g1~~TRINITY_DN16134_c0_g1_i1.p1  ORF type:complete len:648 (+),score=83.12 TRINITY_DN16134_c0_g1_i1:83-2026(+)